MNNNRNYNRTPDPTKAILGANTRWLYPEVFVPRSMEYGKRPVYSVRLLIRKDAEKTLSALNDALDAAYDAGREVIRNSDGSVPGFGKLRAGLRDGDEDYPKSSLYAGHYYVDASSLFAPEVLDRDLQPIRDRDAVYSGVFGRASVSFHVYRGARGKCGFSCRLHGLQKMKDGEPILTVSHAKSDFRSAGETDDEAGGGNDGTGEETLPF